MRGIGRWVGSFGNARNMLHRIYYLWRVFATGLAFLIFGLGGLTLTFIAFPILVLITRDIEVRQFRVQGLVYYLFKFFIGFLTFLRLIKVTVIGHERLLSCRGNLIIANHPSLLDVVVLMSLMPKLQCIVKSALWNNRFIGGVVHAANYIRNDGEPEEIINQCTQILQAGQNVMLFPEGTRTEPGSDVKFKRGAANIALGAGANIQLVKISLTPTTLTKGTPWYRVAPTCVKIIITVGDCLDISQYLLQETRSIAARELTRELEKYFIGK